MTRRLAAAVAVVALVATACGSRVKDWPEGSLAPADYYVDGRSTTGQGSATTVADDDSPADTDSATDTTAARSERSPTTTQPAGKVTGAAFAHPADGTYTYDVTIQFPAFEDEPASTDTDSYSVGWRTNGTAASATLEQREFYGTDPDDGAYVSTYQLSASALELVKTEESDDSETRCAYKTPVMALKLPLSVGAKWKSDSTCTYEDGEIYDHTISASEVTGQTTDSIGGKTITVFVIKVKQTYGDDEYMTQSEATLHVDPATLLVVRETRSDSDDAIGTVTATRVLKSLTPK